MNLKNKKKILVSLIYTLHILDFLKAFKKLWVFCVHFPR